MRIKFIAFFMLLFVVSGDSFASLNEELDKFAKSLIEIVTYGEREEFSKIECMKISCGDIGTEIVFDDKRKPRSFKSIMSQDDLTYKIIGPFTIEPEFPDSSFTIVFYSISNSPFDVNNEISRSKGFAELYKSFLMTQVTVVGDKIVFQRVPFYLEAHHPFVGDYG